MNRQLLQQALDALTNCLSEHGHRCNRCDSEIDEGGKLIAALREALNAPEPEPVAEVFDTFGNSQDPNKAVGHVRLKAHYFPPKGAKLYAVPPAPAAPVVPLTDEQLAKIAVEDEFLLYCDQDSFNEIARAIEAAHGITGASK